MKLNTELVRERVLGIKTEYKAITEVQLAKRPPGPVSRLPPPRLLLYPFQE